MFLFFIMWIPKFCFWRKQNYTNTHLHTFCSVLVSQEAFLPHVNGMAARHFWKEKAMGEISMYSLRVTFRKQQCITLIVTENDNI